MHTFSIVTAVYNVEPYLGECIESVLHQDYDLARVQLILVDDGSTDGSGALCDAWAAKHPDTITVIHKENGGVSSARNEGLNHVRGEYVNFLDADDKLAPNALREADRFFAAHEEVDLASMPVYFFGRYEGQHILNYKYSRGSRVIDLRREFDAIQLFVNSAFIRSACIRDLRFDTRLKYAEDAKICIEVLRHKQKMGVIAGTKYLYRKREGGEQSALDKQISNRATYLPYVTYFTNDVMDSFQGRPIPRFVQYLLLYDLQWRMRYESKKVRTVLSDEEWAEYREQALKAAVRMDDEVILLQRNLVTEYKVFLLTRKYHSPMRVEWSDGKAACYVNDLFVCHLENLPVWLEFIRMEQDQVIIEGRISYYADLQDRDLRIAAGVNGHTIEAALDTVRQVKAEILGENCLYTLNFRVAIPRKILGPGDTVTFATILEGKRVLHRKVLPTKFFPVGFTDPHAYGVVGPFLLSIREPGLNLALRSGLSHAIREASYLTWLWGSRRKGARKAVAVRLLYYVLKPFMNRHTWLISDRVNKADDNGEAFFKYLHDIGSRQKRYFVIREDSPDYEKVRQYGPVLPHYSLRHRLTHLFAEAILSSAGEDEVFCPFWNRAFYRDLLYGQKKIFLQHGVIQDDLTHWLNRYNKGLDLFVTSARPEYESILHGAYYYDSNVVKLTGLARHDRLYDRKERIITIMPTWRQYLIAGGDYGRTGKDVYDPSFLESAYFQFYNGLINDGRLLEAVRVHGYTLQFMPHPRVIPYVDRFERKEGVRFGSIETKYRDVFAESSLLVTDYSSTAFDFAFLRKPVLYVQFDKETFFANHTCEPGYFDYERDGFGEVSYDLDTLVDRIIGYMEAGCPLKDAYRERIDRFFAFHDRNNCRRIHEAIRSVLGRKD